MSEPLAVVLRREAYVSDPEIVTKRWGSEEIYINHHYCMKRITINAFCKTSMHFHIEKHETIYVQQGLLKLSYRDSEARTHVVVLSPGDAIVIPPGFQHQLEALDERTVLIEASTFDQKEDSVRVSM